MLQQRLALVNGQPVADSDAMLPDALHAWNARSEIRTEEAGIEASYASRRTAANRRLIVEAA